jgi:hypothetical protein
VVEGGKGLGFCVWVNGGGGCGNILRELVHIMKILK